MKGSLVLIGIVATLAAAPAAHAAVRAYPSSQTVPPSGPVAGGGGAAAAALNVAAGEREGFWAVASGAGKVAATIDRGSLGPIHAGLYFGHYVMFGKRAVPDALIEWDGSVRDAERPNQPVYVQVFVPRDTRPGVYRGSVNVYTDGKPNPIPFSVHVFPVVLPAPGTAGNFQTSFHVSPQSYLNKTASLYGYTRHEQRIEANTRLFAFLSAYRISPGSWGFGAPSSARGYESSTKWWLDNAGMMRRQVAAGPFQALRIPISSNRSTEANRIAGVAFNRPETWCDYLKSTRAFWDEHGWLNGTLQYLYALDEPDLAGQKLVARQSRVLHACWPGAKSLMTGNPSRANAFLWDGTDDDLDIWVVLSRRFYGRFTVPTEQKLNNSRMREHFDVIQAVRKRGRQVWSYAYSGPAGTPGFAATEPLWSPRMLLLWNALEGTRGVLYGQGTTSYAAGNPLVSVDRNGEYVLIYPGDARGPIASARLEQIRDGIEDATLFSLLRGKRGAGAVRSILGGAGLFSADAKGVKLACSVGCDLKSTTTYSWPAWSNSVRTPAQIEAAKLAALKALS